MSELGVAKNVCKANGLEMLPIRAVKASDN